MTEITTQMQALAKEIQELEASKATKIYEFHMGIEHKIAQLAVKLSALILQTLQAEDQ